MSNSLSEEEEMEAVQNDTHARGAIRSKIGPARCRQEEKKEREGEGEGEGMEGGVYSESYTREARNITGWDQRAVGRRGY